MLQINIKAVEAGALGDAPAMPRIAHVPIGEPAHAHRVVVAAREQGSAGWRTKRCRVEIRVSQAPGGEGIDIRRCDLGSITAEVREAHIIEHDVDNIRLARLRRDGFRPPWL